MANIALGQQLPPGVFDPHPDPATLPQNLGIVGSCIASAAIYAALSLPPHFVISSTMYILYIILLAFIALGGVAMILIGWMVADAPDTYAPLGRATLRASHFVLVFAFAVHQFASTSTTQEFGPTK